MKSLCSEIVQIVPKEKINEQRMRRIIINGMKPEYSSFMAAIQGWSTQPTLLELENMLANQEALAKQMAGVSLKQEEKDLFSSQKKARPNNKLKPKFEGKTNQQMRPKQRSHASGGARNHLRSNEYQDDRCYNCGKKGHYARDCWHKKKKGQWNVATSSNQQQAKGQESCDSEEDWDAEAACAVATIEEEKEEKDEVALMEASKSRQNQL